MGMALVDSDIVRSMADDLNEYALESSADFIAIPAGRWRMFYSMLCDAMELPDMALPGETQQQSALTPAE